MTHKDVWCMARDAYYVDRQGILRKYAAARADRPPEMTVDVELFMTYAKTVKKYRWQYMNLTW